MWVAEWVRHKIKITNSNGAIPEWHLLKPKMHIISVNSSLRGTKQSLAGRHQMLIDCRATARNDGDFGLSKCHSGHTSHDSGSVQRVKFSS